jgi:hypothetical protein
LADCRHPQRQARGGEHRAHGHNLVGQPLFAIALGYADLNDHDELPHDIVMAALAGKLKARRKRCAPVAEKSWPQGPPRTMMMW